jgi:hypothetical protein
MRKLAALVVLAAGIGFPCLATAADVVDLMCRPRIDVHPLGINTGSIVISGVAPSAGVTVPPSCAFGSLNCAQCQADLLSQGFTQRVAGGTEGFSVWFQFTRATPP